LKYSRYCLDFKPMKFVQIFAGVSLFCANTLVIASVSLDRAIKEKGDELASVSAMLEGNEGRLLILNNENAVLTEYKGKAGDRYLISNVDDNSIAIIDAEGNLIQKFGESGSEEGQLASPAGIDWSHNGRLYVADKGNNRISVFGLDGVFIKAIGQRGLKESEQLEEPEQVFVDLKERVYVLEKRNNGIVTIFDHNGKLLQRINNKAFNKIAGGDTEIITITIDAKGLLYAADRENGRILQIDWLTKKLISSFGSKGEQRGQFEEVSAMVVLPGNKLAVADGENKKIEIYRLDENKVKLLDKSYLPTVAYERSIKLNCTMAYRLRGGNVLCLDSDNGKVSTFKSSGKKVTDFEGEFSDIKGAAIDDQMVVLLDGEKLKFYKLDGKMRFEVGSSGEADGKFDSPKGVFLTRDEVYVADTGNQRIQVFSRDGIYLNKVSNPKNSEKVIFKKPVRVAVDNSNNMFVLDAEARQVLVFGPNRNLLYRIGGDLDQEEAENKILDEVYTDLYDITVDGDGNLYVLAGIEGNDTTVQVFNGPTEIVSFGARVEGRVGLNEPVSISIPPANKTIVSVFDKELKAVKNYKFKQLPSRPGGLKVRGAIKNIQLSWDKVPGSYTSRYKIYGAREKDGEFKYVTDVAGLTTTIGLQQL